MEPQDLNANEVHIWSASLLENINNINYFYSILSKDECERANSFRFSKDQIQFTITRGILRQLLSNYLRQSPESIEIMYGLWGKPCLPEEKSLHFNVSHSGDYALYAIARHYEVGIDLEYIDKNLECENMAFHIFSETELTEWKLLNPEERVNSFYRRWVSREAFLKASGKGWLEDKRDLSFSDKKKSGKDNLNDEATNLYSFECIPDYAGALFVDGALLIPHHYSCSQNNFIKVT